MNGEGVEFGGKGNQKSLSNASFTLCTHNEEEEDIERKTEWKIHPHTTNSTHKW